MDAVSNLLADPMAERPVFIEPLVGWRTWDLETDQTPPRFDPFRSKGGWAGRSGAWGDGQFRLVTGLDTEWPARERLTAHCRLSRGDHPAPELKCSCGIYAARSHRILRERGYAAEPDDWAWPSDIVGEVFLWGRVMESSEILRAEFAYPKRLFIPHLRRWAEPLRQTYGVPVEIKNPFTMHTMEVDR